MAKVVNLKIISPEERRLKAFIDFLGRVSKSEDPLVQNAVYRLRRELQLLQNKSK